MSQLQDSEKIRQSKLCVHGRRCLILASAKDVWDDLKAAQQLAEFDAVICVKRTGIVYNAPFFAWITLHPEWQNDFNAKRKSKGFELPERIVAHRAGKGVTYVMPEHSFPEMNGNSGSSGWFAVKYAYEMGFEKIVLCGMGYTRDSGRIDGKPVWESANNYCNHIRPTFKRLDGIVKSMSGFTRDCLGSPTEQWLYN
jgi:hypothetical protein